MKRVRIILTTRDMTVFALLGTLLFVGDIVFESIPNVHPVTALLAAYTLVYRWKALIPLYVYVFMTGLSWGFSAFWIPYLYAWLPLVMLVLLIPRRVPFVFRCVLCVAVCALHGLAFGLLWAPFQMLAFRWSLEAVFTWVLMGLPYDALHAVGNAVAASLIVMPLSLLLAKLEKRRP